MARSTIEVSVARTTSLSSVRLQMGRSGMAISGGDPGLSTSVRRTRPLAEPAQRLRDLCHDRLARRAPRDQAHHVVLGELRVLEQEPDDQGVGIRQELLEGPSARAPRERSTFAERELAPRAIVGDGQLGRRTIHHHRRRPAPQQSREPEQVAGLGFFSQAIHARARPSADQVQRQGQERLPRLGVRALALVAQLVEQAGRARNRPQLELLRQPSHADTGVREGEQ